MAREPGYCRHKPTNQAYVNLDGQVVYLGEYGSEKSKQRYNQLKAEWLLNRKSKATRQAVRSKAVTVSDVCNAFLDHAATYYQESNEEYQYKLAIQPLAELYATMKVKDFTPLHFRCCRDWWTRDATRSRPYINKMMRRLRTVFKWAVGMNLCPAPVSDALRCVDPLKRGRCEAPETEPILPVEQSVVDATLPFLTQVVGDMVRLQQLLGCRPGEICSVTPGMVDRSEDVWRIRLAKHKTAYRGKERVIFVGPKAQAVLAKYLLRPSDKPCFSPIESEQQRRAAAHAARRTPLSCGNRPGSNRVGRKPRKAPSKAFTAGTYGRSIRYACLRAFPAPKGLSKAQVSEWNRSHSWAPNQLRHSRATEIRKEYGLEAAQIVLGHSSADITQVYAERDIQRGIEIARRIG
jgi:integrase